MGDAPKLYFLSPKQGLNPQTSYLSLCPLEMDISVQIFHFREVVQDPPWTRARTTGEKRRA